MPDMCFIVAVAKVVVDAGGKSADYAIIEAMLSEKFA